MPVIENEQPAFPLNFTPTGLVTPLEMVTSPFSSYDRVSFLTNFSHLSWGEVESFERRDEVPVKGDIFIALIDFVRS